MFDDYRSPYAKSEVLLAGMREDARVENSAIAARLRKIGELFTLRRRENGEHKDWAVDTWAEVGAEVSAALGCTIAMAGSYLYYARAMTDRLPAVAEVFTRGDIDFRTFQTICYRTELVADDAAMAEVDRQLAARAPRWGALSKSRLASAIDRLVCRTDPEAVRRKREHLDRRGVIFWSAGGGLGGMSATMLLGDADTLEARLEALANTVCDHDPREADQRRADALGALGAGQDRLSCRCGNPDCPAGGSLPSPPQVTIHLVAEQASVDARCDTPSYHLQSGELVPAELVAELARQATLRPLVHPGDAAPEPRYTPSRTLAEYVRARDLTCRAPHCDRPSVSCDVDHTIPYADGGPTHASNLKCLCRLHHRLAKEHLSECRPLVAATSVPSQHDRAIADNRVQHRRDGAVVGAISISCPVSIC